jgi:hypothetical protein
MSDEHSWDQLPEEDQRSYQAFATYRDLGTTRSLSAVAEKLGWSKVDQLEHWRWLHAWDYRAQEFDAYQPSEGERRTERIQQTASILRGRAVQRLNALAVDQLTPDQMLRFLEAAARLEESLPPQ